MGVFYYQGFGVAKNVDKAIDMLVKASKTGNGQSSYQLYEIYLNDESHKDVKKAYYYLEKALLRGVSLFDKLQELFKDNYEQLAQVFLENKKLSLVDKDNQQEVLNLHEAHVNELKNSFSQALGRDRLYQRPVGFMQDQ